MTRVNFTYICGEGIYLGNCTVADSVWVRICPTKWLIPDRDTSTPSYKNTHTNFGD